MIVVTAPTGQIGSQLVRDLLAAQQAVRVIVRDVARLPADIRAQVDAVPGSHGDAAVVRDAFDGAAAVFWLVPGNPAAHSVAAAYVDFSRPACDAFTRAGVRHVVGVSSLGRGRPQAARAGQITASLAMDDLIAGTGVNYRALTMPGFMDNTLRQLAAIKSHGVIRAPLPGDLKAATCATRDIAAVAAKLLVDRSWTGHGEVAVLGPEDLSFNDMAAIIGAVLSRPIRFEQMSDAAMKAALLERGQSDAMAQASVDLYAAVRDGIYSNVPRTPQTNTPTSFRQWCETVLKPAVLR